MKTALKVAASSAYLNMHRSLAGPQKSADGSRTKRGTKSIWVNFQQVNNQQGGGKCGYNAKKVSRHAGYLLTSLLMEEYNRQIEKLSSERYQETNTLRQINGVGPLTALAFILIIEEHRRFSSSRDVGPFLGLTPKRDQSGEIDKQLRITKAGNTYLRKLLVNCAHYILGPFGTDCDLKRFGLKKMGKGGGKIAKRRAVVAVARKLAVLMHRLWRTGEIYEPFFQQNNQLQRAA